MFTANPTLILAFVATGCLLFFGVGLFWKAIAQAVKIAIFVCAAFLLAGYSKTAFSPEGRAELEDRLVDAVKMAMFVQSHVREQLAQYEIEVRIRKRDEAKASGEQAL